MRWWMSRMAGAASVVTMVKVVTGCAPFSQRSHRPAKAKGRRSSKLIR